MRASFESKDAQRLFFRLSKGKMTWMELYRKTVNITLSAASFRVFEAWAYGKFLPPYDVVKALCRISGRRVSDLSLTLLPENWGQVIGGRKKSRLYDSNLTIIDRRKGGKIGRKSIERLKRIAHKGVYVRTARKYVGPRNEMMFNRLEQKVAEILYRNEREYEYESIIQIKNRAIVPDFFLPKLRTLIECTTWTNVEEKAEEINRKARVLMKGKAIDHFIVVTSDQRLKQYKETIEKPVKVVTTKGLINTLSMIK